MPRVKLGGPVFQAAGPDYPKIFNQTGSLGARPSLDESITRAFSISADFSYTSAPMFHILHILSLLAFFLAICHHCQGSLGGVMWFGPWIFASENSSWWTALLWQTVCLYPDAWGICTIMSSLNVHDDMVLTDAPSVGSLRRDLSKQTVPRPTTTRPRHVDQNKHVATIQHVFFTCEAFYKETWLMLHMFQHVSTIPIRTQRVVSESFVLLPGDLEESADTLLRWSPPTRSMRPRPRCLTEPWLMGNIG